MHGRAVSPSGPDRVSRKIAKRKASRLARSAERRRIQSLEAKYRHKIVEDPIPPEEHEGDLKVLFVSGSDYAFMGYTLAQCLNSVGIKAIAASGRYSPLRPQSQQGYVYKVDELYDLVKETYVVIWMHSTFREFPPNILKGKKCVVFHGGTKYRRGSQFINRLINPRVHLSLVQTGELLGRGAKNEHWFLPPIDTEGIKPNYNFDGDGRLVIGHFTSHPRRVYVKGTALIESTMKLFEKGAWKDRFVFRRATEGHHVPWAENMHRMSKCDIYIESLSQGQPHNKNRHDWSVQALESCALGCITITNFLFEDAYKREYGDHGLLVANSANDLKRILKSLFQMKKEDLLNLKRKARQWVELKHSYKVVGKQLGHILGLDTYLQ